MSAQPSWLDRLYPQPDPNMLKRSLFTNITPLPATVSRETAVSQLHDHSSMIELNPIVLRHIQTTPPPNAPQDEASQMKWYEITDEIQYLPGTRLKGQTSYKAGFYNMPNGLQTHVFAPAGVDIQAKWSVGGNASGEEREPIEIGVDKPREGLYMREDVNLRCNVFLMNFVKRNLNKSHKVMVDSLLKKADLAEESKSQTIQTDSGYLSHTDSRQRTPNDTPSSLQATNSWPKSKPTATHSQSYQNKPNEDRSSSNASPLPQSGRRKSSDAISPAYSWTQTPTNARATDQCNCSGGVHAAGCPFYPGLRLTHKRLQSQSPSHEDSRPFFASNELRREQQAYSEGGSTAMLLSGSGQPAQKSGAAQRDAGWVDLEWKSGQASQKQQTQNDVAMELDGNPVAAQYYYKYQGQRAAELE